MPFKVPHHIIAIGASAGGMEEINTFFDHTPLDGVAYIIIQHLSPDFKSRMAELLDKHSKLEVKEVENEMLVETNKVYLTPNDKFMNIRNGHLYLTDKGNTQGPHLTINRFFYSLATDAEIKAIGIVLSGMGHDGTDGIRAIKKAGGMVIARNPETSAFGSMPASAIATGLVDYVLEPEAMPAIIESYVTSGGDEVQDNDHDEKSIAAIINLIREQSGHDFSDYKQNTIVRRIKRRGAALNYSSLEKYTDFLKETPDEVENLAKDFLISVTSFFRDKEAFAFIQSNVLPGILGKLAPGEELKLWVAGCATGEEAYSIAILISEQLKGSLKDTVVKIFATDIDNIALLHAGKGNFSKGITKDVSEERLERFFNNEGDYFQVKPEIRKMVIFAQHDMVKNPPYCNMHFISCRNVLIYMTPVLQKKIFQMMLFGLKMEGYLFLGSSENPMPIIQNLEVVSNKWKIYKNLESKRTIRFDAFSLPELKNLPTVFTKEDMSKNTGITLTEAVNETLVNDSDYLLICIDENNHVVKTYGDTTKYLLQKNFTTNLTELLPKPLTVAFNTLSNNALKTNKKVSVRGIQIRNGQRTLNVSLSVGPVITKNKDKRLFLVTFKEDVLSDNLNQEDFVFNEAIYINQYTSNLEKELRELKDNLHSAYLQLDASNENMHSFHEELLSANEEMQSTNEEMQSVNEELHTINADYQLKNRELLEINDDLNNYFKSNINGQLFVDNNLLLIKFSPGTVKQINLQASDIGRPLSDISTNIKFETILDDIKHVIADGKIITKEIETNGGQWYQVMTMPYIQQADNKVNGAIISFNDITELKRTQVELDKTNKSLLLINADLDNFVYTISHDLLSPLANIEGSISILNSMAIPDPELQAVQSMIDSSIKKFKSLINDVASIAKSQSEVLAAESINLDEIIDNIEWSLSDNIKESSALINRKLEVKYVHFSKKNMRSVLFNLISNGIKFKSDKSPVLIIVSVMEGDNMILSVQDNGTGIPQEGVDKIFNMYGRLQKDIEGQGIGLYLVKKIVNASNGEITVESELGNGTKFIIKLKVGIEQEAITALNRDRLPSVEGQF